MAIVSCRCGETEIEVSGKPILVAACHCDDCQTGGRMLEALPGAPPVLDAAGGTGYALYRKDRFSRGKGAERLEAHKIRKSPTNRIVASCCNTAMMMDYDSGPHWISIYRDRMSAPPKLDMHVNMKFAPPGSPTPDDAPAYATFPPRFVWRLVVARMAMMFGR